MTEQGSGVSRLLEELQAACAEDKDLNVLTRDEIDAIAQVLISHRFSDNRKGAQQGLDRLLGDIAVRLHEDGRNAT